MAKRPTANDVARMAGVSRTTVSFVLNDVPGMRISADTRQKVLFAAQELDYHPHASARRLVTGQTHIIAYVQRQSPARALADAFLPRVLLGVHDAAADANFEILFAPVPIESGEHRCFHLLRGRHVDGIIFSGPRADDQELRELFEARAPVVLQGHWPDLQVPSVDVDNMKAARMATEHLLQLGHQDIGIIVHSDTVYTAADYRLRGYRQALEQRGMAFRAGFVVTADFTPASGEAALEQLLHVRPQPTAIFATNDTVAVGALHAARRLGLRVPDDLAVVGFDDIPFAVYTDPPLTTIRLPAYGIGWGAAHLLIRLILENEIEESQILLETDLIIRQSCGAKLA
jgi:LacI family transcriptional regulator